MDATVEVVDLSGVAAVTDIYAMPATDRYAVIDTVPHMWRPFTQCLDVGLC